MRFPSRVAPLRVVVMAAAALASAGAAEAPPDPKSPPVYFSGNAWFSVVADRSAAGSYVSSVAERVSAVLARFGFSSAQLMPGGVTVYVNSGDGPPDAVEDGPRTLLYLPLAKIPGGADSPALAADRAVARALVRAALTQLARTAGAKAAPKDWILEGLAWESQVAAFPGELEWLVRTASEQGPGTLAQLDAPNPENLGGHSRAAFLLVRTFADKPSDISGRIVAEAALGKPIEVCLAPVAPALARGGDIAAAWWPAAFYREVDRRPSAVASPAFSARRFAEMSRFVVWETPPLEKEPRDLVLDAEGLIARRGDKSLRTAVEARILAIKRELLRANPVWFNALRDYGVFLEKLSTASPEELRGLAAGVSSEVGRARTLTAEIERALRGELEAR